MMLESRRWAPGGGMSGTRFDLVDRLDGVSEWRHRDNGLTVLVWPTPVAPVVGFGVVYRVGSRHEVTGHTGATHILEHLMFKGSRRFNRESGTEIARVLHRVGANFNATTWLDRTSYYEVLPAEHLARLRDAAALLHVVRAWDDPHHPHPAGSVDPWRDLEQLDLEFTLADLAVVDRRLERLRSSGRHGTPAEREANEREGVILERLREGLVDGRPIRDVGLAPDEAKAVRGFRFLTEKPVLVLLNVGEADLGRGPDMAAEITERYEHRHALVDALVGDVRDAVDATAH
jgi:hypothetical protein